MLGENSNNLSYEGLFTFNYLQSDNELLAPILYKDIITKKKYHMMKLGNSINIY